MPEVIAAFSPVGNVWWLLEKRDSVNLYGRIEGHLVIGEKTDTVPHLTLWKKATYTPDGWRDEASGQTIVGDYYFLLVEDDMLYGRSERSQAVPQLGSEES